ncbi:MAG: hypothetical protein ACF8PN_00855 [Phycisphaerales bacterium]
MSFSGRQRILLETNMARDKAEALLAGLINAQRVVDRQTPNDLGGDIVSRESIDRAISTTKRLIATLNESLRGAYDDLSDPELAILDELDASAVESAHDGSGSPEEFASFEAEIETNQTDARRAKSTDTA